MEETVTGKLLIAIVYIAIMFLTMKRPIVNMYKQIKYWNKTPPPEDKNFKDNV